VQEMDPLANHGESSHVFYRSPGQSLPIVVRGEGVELWDATGHRVIDLASGISTTASIGQGRSSVAEAMATQAKQLAFIHNSWVTNPRQEELAARYAALAPSDVNRVMFTSGGSEANELSLRIARQYHLAKGQPHKWKVVSLSPSYHGATMGALTMTGRWEIHGDYAPYLFGGARVVPPVRFRGPFRDLEPKEAAARAAEMLADVIEAEGPDSVGVFVAEPVSPSWGMEVADASYWSKVREICDRYDVLFIADEVVTGAGRCGSFLAMDHFGVTADLSNLGKGLTGGYAPLAATLVRDRVAETIQSAGRGVAAVHTYSGNPIGCAVGLEVLDIMEAEGLYVRSRDRGEFSMKMLSEAIGDHPNVGGIRGLGLLIGIEYVGSKDTREPLDVSFNVSRRLWDAMWARGYLLRTLHHGSVLVGDATNFVPALTIDEHDLEGAAGALRDSLDEVFGR
jgi:adenosylmethionine-8-amino-7-oxononanoate aminotransferase